MKQGRTLQELATELARINEAKADYIAPARALVAQPLDSGEIGLTLDGVGDFAVRPFVHTQLRALLAGEADAQRVHSYYEAMRTRAPELLAANLNYWLAKSDARKLVRTIDTDARAVLSDRYRRIDNYDLVSALLPEVQKMGLDIEIRSCEVTERKLYLKITTPKLEGTVVGQTIRAGVLIFNSEIGCGSYGVSEFNENLACLNGMIVEKKIRGAHIGRRHAGDLDIAEELKSTETKQVEDRVLFLKMRDQIRAALSEENFDRLLAKFRTAADTKLDLTAPLPEVVKLTGEKLGLTQGENENVLTHLMTGGDLSAWGVANAITRTSQDLDDYDRATELEAIGGKVIDLSPKDWEVITDEARSEKAAA